MGSGGEKIAIRVRMEVLMTKSYSAEGLNNEEYEELVHIHAKYRVYIDSAASQSVFKHIEMFLPGTYEACRGTVTASTEGARVARIVGKGKVMFMGRRIGVFHAPDMAYNILSEGALCAVYSFRIVKEREYVIVTDLVSPQHRNVASWKGTGNMYPVPEALLL
jgi:hypothetical protein